MGSAVHKTAMADSFVAGFIRLSVYLSSTTRCRPPSRGVNVLRSHPQDSQRGSMHDPANEVRRIYLPRTPVNKKKHAQLEDAPLSLRGTGAMRRYGTER